MKKERIDSLSSRIIRYYKTQKQAGKNVPVLSENEKKEWIQDIVKNVKIKKMEIDITFKHPFESFKEAHTFET